MWGIAPGSLRHVRILEGHMDGTDVSEPTNQTAVEETAPQGAAADVAATAVDVAEESTASSAEARTVSEPAATNEDGELDAASLMEQFLNDPSHDYKSLKYGDVMDAVISIDRARQEKSWRRLQELHEANEVIEAEVTNYNKGGLLIHLYAVRGFVPASQVTEIRGGDEASK